MSRMLYGALEKCKVENSEIILEGLTKEETNELRNIILHDLLEFNIPHYKVIGVDVVTPSNIEVDYITKIRGTNKSYAELNAAVDLLVCAKGAAHSEFQNSEAECLPLIVSTDYVVKTNEESLSFVHSGYRDSIVKCLVADYEIIRFHGSGVKVCFKLRRSKGVLDFKDNGYILRDTDYKPVRTIYDLTKFFVVPMFDIEENKIKLRYKKKLDEKVIEGILQEYARDHLQEEY